MVVSVSIAHPSDLQADWELQLERIIGHIASRGKDPNSKSKGWFPLNVYLFCIINQEILSGVMISRDCVYICILPDIDR